MRALCVDAGDMMMVHASVRAVDEVGRGNLSAAEEAEFFRTFPGSRVNNHPARFVAWGRQAAYLFSSQPWDYAFGRDSALDRVVAQDGRILLLGSDHDTVTFLHYVEHIADIPHKRVTRVHANWPDRFFAKLVDASHRVAEQGRPRRQCAVLSAIGTPAARVFSTADGARGDRRRRRQCAGRAARTMLSGLNAVRLCVNFGAKR